MLAFLLEWLNVLLRWAHVTAAIMWIGDSFLFMWMDSSLEKPRAGRSGDVSGELWMTHSGGFYEVVKHRTLAALPEKLWWFKWQSYATWFTGVLLLTVVYGLGGRAMLLDTGSPLSHAAGFAIVAGVLTAGWLLYDGLNRVPGLTGLRLGAVGLPLIAGAAWALGHVFTPRAAFLLVGATLGTIMAGNVFSVIIPGQGRMLAATRAGLPVDTAHGRRAKERSTHNHYLTLPVLFTMLSNHFPALYGNAHAWAVLALMVVAGAAAKLAMNTRERTPWWAVLGLVLSLGGVVALTRPPGESPAVRALDRHAPVDDATARLIVQTRCVMCHSSRPTQPGFATAPNGVMFDSAELMRAYADRIVYRVVETRTMPLANMSGITDDERVTLGAWARQQTHGR